MEVQDTWFSAEDIASSTYISERGLGTILKKHLRLRNICAWQIPHSPTEECKKQILNFAWDFLEKKKKKLW